MDFEQGDGSDPAGGILRIDLQRWKGRALKAEARVSALEALVTVLRFQIEEPEILSAAIEELINRERT